MEIIEEDNLCDNAATVGEYLQNQLINISEKYPIISNVRGKGLLTAFDFPDKTTRDKFIKLGMERNVMFLGCGEHSIRFRPALIIDEKHIEEGLTILENISASL
jgi:L-lysine 6-transaminase